MEKVKGEVKGKVLTASNQWIENIKELELSRKTEFNLWSNKGSVLDENDYVYVYDTCKNGIGKIHLTSLFVRNEILSVGVAWEIYGERNGARNFEEFKQMVCKTLNVSPEDDIENYSLKCTIIDNICPIINTEIFIKLEGRGQIRESGRFV